MSPLTLTAHREALRGGRHLRLMNYHNTPPSRRGALRDELGALAEHRTPWTLDDLDHAFATGQGPGGARGEKPGFLAVFYEGYAASASVAAQVCDELGITAWFALCTGWIDCPPDQQELFARAHHIALMPEDLEGERLAMSWDEVADVSSRHVVFPHTASHDGFDSPATPGDLAREVLEPKRRLDAVTGQDAPAFAWLHGSPTGVSAAHDAAVRAAGYRYLISNTAIHRL